MDYGFLGEMESEEHRVESCVGHPGTETQDDVGNAGTEKGNGVSLDRKESSEDSSINFGHNRDTLRCDSEPAIEAVARGNRTSSPRR